MSSVLLLNLDFLLLLDFFLVREVVSGSGGRGGGPHWSHYLALQLNLLLERHLQQNFLPVFLWQENHLHVDYLHVDYLHMSWQEALHVRTQLLAWR